MNLLRTVLSILALGIAGFACADPIPATQESALGFKSYDLPSEQTGIFEVAFDAMPLTDKIDAFTGVAAKVPSSGNDVAAMVRFNDSGRIDVRDGSVFRADQALPYSANKTYRVRMVVDVARKTYSVFAAPEGQPELALAKNYAFRNQQSGALKQFVLAGFKDPNGYFKGPHRVSGVTVKAAP